MLSIGAAGLFHQSLQGHVFTKAGMTEGPQFWRIH